MSAISLIGWLLLTGGTMVTPFGPIQLDSPNPAENIANVNGAISINLGAGQRGPRHRDINILSYAFNCESDKNIMATVKITTPLKARSGEMYRFDLTGFYYQKGLPLGITWVGYLYASANSNELVIRKQEVNNLDNLGEKLTVGQFIGDDDRLILSFGPINIYCLSFNLDYLSGAWTQPNKSLDGTFEVGHEPVER